MTIFATVVLMVTAATAQAPPQALSMAAEPFHKLLLQNQYTRVFRVDLEPGQATQVHRHDHDYVAVHLSDAQLENARQGQQPAMQAVKLGQVSFSPGGFSHRVVNKGNTVFRVLAIEILKPARGPHAPGAKPERGLEMGSGSSVDTIIDNNEVRVTESLIAPGATLDERHSRPYLMVALSALDLHTAGKRNSGALQANFGDATWFASPVTRTVTNMGKQQARFIAVEFK